MRGLSGTVDRTDPVLAVSFLNKPCTACERYLVSEFGTVQPLVFGHFGEINSRFQTLIDELAEVVRAEDGGGV